MRVIKAIFLISFTFVNLAVIAFIAYILLSGQPVSEGLQSIIDKFVVTEETEELVEDETVGEVKEDVENDSVQMESSLKNKEAMVEMQETKSDGVLRNNTPNVLGIKEMNYDEVEKDEKGVFMMDTSNFRSGYVIVYYDGKNKSKLLVTNEYANTYIYTLSCQKEIVIPLTSGDGKYTFEFYENVKDDMYLTLYKDTFYFDQIDEFEPYLRPNYYVNFTEDDDSVKLAKELAKGCYTDIDVIKNVYDYISKNITYDYEKADNVQSNYIPDADSTLQSKKGICFDYAVLISAMLRSQNIPTRLEIGYCDTTYHAWVSVYTKELGWINKMLWFNGNEWTLLDPVVASNDVDYYLSDVTYYSKYNY